MEQDILTRLYFGKIIPWEKRASVDPEAASIRNRINEAIPALEAMLPKEGAELLWQLMSDCSDLEALVICEGFKDGYCLGTRLTAAAFCGGERP